MPLGPDELGSSGDNVGTSERAEVTGTAQNMPLQRREPSKDSDNEYHESEDEDFEPEAESESEKEADAEFSNETEQYKDVQGTGFVKTRSQRRSGQPETRVKQASVVGSQTVDVDALWKEMNSGESRKQTNTSEEFVDIKRTLKFAGEVQTEIKRVPRSSAEAQEYLRSLEDDQSASISTDTAKDNAKDSLQDGASAGSSGGASGGTSGGAKDGEKDKGRPKPRPRKRKMSLLEEYEAGKARKVNTLEKSRLDWLGFVDKEGIQDDLKRHNRNGYLDKQGFLARVEHKMGEDIRSHRRS